MSISIGKTIKSPQSADPANCGLLFQINLLRYFSRNPVEGFVIKKPSSGT
ncbi:hypothetical protein PRIO_2651 [Paenibacillus riograndensis SBR5]|uniref:Uncharacterized protein n=1 Tax=Paenibacillus riograndensis SBR5 TaxID=1073571 RepID=A0A0E4CW98_9BACL|nr:hypothetical protein PRIO_2651 [Paenibacillus riograndensis SBR5]